MARKFKIGDMIVVKKCGDDGHLCFKCNNRVLEVKEIYCDSDGLRYDFGPCYTIAREARLATEQEQFLYLMYGTIKPEEL